MEAFVYSLSDVSNGKIYVGWHKGSIDDGYICSSKIVKEEYNKRSKDFIRTIIAMGTAEDMVKLETKILQSFDAKNDEKCYNMHNGNGLYRLGAHNNETKRKISKSKIGIKRPDLSERNKTELNPAKMGLCGRDTSKEKNPMYGKTHNENSKIKMSENRRGKGTQRKSEETKRKMAEARKKYWELKKNGS